MHRTEIPDRLTAPLNHSSRLCQSNSRQSTEAPPPSCFRYHGALALGFIMAGETRESNFLGFQDSFASRSESRTPFTATKVGFRRAYVNLSGVPGLLPPPSETSVDAPVGRFLGSNRSRLQGLGFQEMDSSRPGAGWVYGTTFYVPGGAGALACGLLLAIAQSGQSLTH